jgi:hypothetical protein
MFDEHTISPHTHGHLDRRSVWIPTTPAGA